MELINGSMTWSATPDEKTIRVVQNRLEPRALPRALLGPRRCRTGPDGSPSKKVRAYRARRAAAQRKALARQRICGVAVDGKASRGARQPDGTRVHLLGVVEHGSGRLLDHVEVDAKHNETTHFTGLLAGLDLDSVAVAERALLPALRAADDAAEFLADGFSCRTQAEQLAGTHGVHLAELLASKL